MSARENIFGKVRAAVAANAATQKDRAKAVAQRMARPPLGVLPARAQLPLPERVELFCARALTLAASVERLKKFDDVPKAVSAYLRDRNLPASVRMGADPRLAALPWGKSRALTLRRGASDGDDETGVSFAAAGIAETGTVALWSGQDNPTTINFLTEHHIVVVDARDIDAALEEVLARVRKAFGKGKMPRSVNFISGPSRSGDVEQKLVLGAHGPRALHLLVVGDVR
ncbi:MAG TPA: lactate utilization protein [Mesorhizobium sp.]|jgi:L-lactate dehydrogenase complex protein LldG|nr:lactate utilization protein [Mesorhizobium sp.]